MAAREERAKLRQFGRRVRERRQEMGFSQVQLGALIGVRQQTIGKCELGTARMSWPKVEALLSVLAGNDTARRDWILSGGAPGRMVTLDRQALAAAIGRIAVIDGPPGTGRTETFLRIARAWRDAFND